MIKIEKDRMAYYRSQLFLKYGFDTFFLTRNGGSSKGELAELNLSFRVDDDPAIVKKNLGKVKRLTGAKTLLTVKQVHGAKVIGLAGGKIDSRALRDTEADAMITDQPGLAIGVLCADCFPVLLAETEKRIIGVCHCGRRGIIEGVIENTVKAMVKKGGRREKMIAAVGPGICGNCYRVDDEVVEEYRGKFGGGGGDKPWRRVPGGFLLDLKKAIFSILAGQGIFGGRTDDLGLCTFENQGFFSHRGSRGRAGRQLSAIMIK